MASPTTAQATTTTLHHNVGNPEEDLSQMLLLYIVGVAAALLAICVARTTKCCMKECRGKPKKKTKFQLEIEASQNNSAESSGQFLHYAVFNAAAHWMDLIHENNKNKKSPPVKTSKSGVGTLEDDANKRHRDEKSKSVTAKALTNCHDQECGDSIEIEETRSSSSAKRKRLNSMESIVEIASKFENPSEHKLNSSVENHPDSTDASSKEDGLFVKANPRKPSVKFDDSVAFCEDLA